MASTDQTNISKLEECDQAILNKYICELKGESYAESTKSNDTRKEVTVRELLEQNCKDEEKDIMKAKAGHEIITEIESRSGETVKLLYLTNAQAAAVANDENSVKVLVEKLCGKQRRDLVIDLVHSWGFLKSTELFDEKWFQSKFCAGLKRSGNPFGDKSEDFEKELLSMAKLDDFMERILIPLAVTSRATIFCHAVANYCILTDSFIRTYRQMSSRWGGNPPFEIIGTMGMVDFFYLKSKSKGVEPVWQFMKDNCDRWKQRDEFLQPLFKEYQNHIGEVTREHDLNWLTRKILVVEGFDTKVLRHNFEKTNLTKNPNSTINDDDPKDLLEQARNWVPFCDLKSAIIRHYANDVSSIAIKTGATSRDTLHTHSSNDRKTMSLQCLLELINMKTKVICLDVRERDDNEIEIKKLYHETLNDECIGKELKKKKVLSFIHECINKELKKITDEGRCESLDCCLIAHLTELARAISDEQSSHLHELCKETLPERITSFKNDQNKDEPTLDYVKIAKHFSLTYYEHLYPYTYEYEKMKVEMNGQMEHVNKKMEAYEYFRNEIDANAAILKKLLASPNFWGLNIVKHNVTKDTVYDIVLGKKRPETPLPCLKVLREAWIEVKKSDLAAERYKKLAKTMMLIQLILAFSITTFSVLLGSSVVIDDKVAREVLKATTFIASLLLSGVVALESLLSPRMKWRQLRVASVSLESTIWKFRMRVGEFQEDLALPTSKEERLKAALTDWREHFMMGSNTTLNYIRGRKRDNKLYESVFALKRINTKGVARKYDKGTKGENNEEDKTKVKSGKVIDMPSGHDVENPPVHENLKGFINIQGSAGPRNDEHLDDYGKFENDPTNNDSVALIRKTSNEHSNNETKDKHPDNTGSLAVKRNPDNASSTKGKQKEADVVRGSAGAKKDQNEQENNNDDPIDDDPIDDHFTALHGKEYVRLRIKTLILLYHDKFSRYEVIHYAPDIFVILLGVVIAMMAQWEIANAVTILVAFLSNFKSWMEFRGRSQKHQLLSNAIDKLRIQHSEWSGQNKFRKFSKDRQSEMVLETENLVMQVVSSWSTSMALIKSPTFQQAETQKQKLKQILDDNQDD